MNGFEAAFSSLLLTSMGLVSGERVIVFSDSLRTAEKPAATDRSGKFHADYRLYIPTLTGKKCDGSTFLILDNGRLQV